MAAPQTHAQPSRKTKSSWRKNINLTDVTSNLDRARDEYIQTGDKGLLADQPSETLFVTDIAGSSSVKEKVRKQFGELKVDQILAQRSAVPALAGRKRKGEEDEEARKKKRVSRKEHERLRQLAYGGETTHKDVVEQQYEGASHDPWADVDSTALIQQNGDLQEQNDETKDEGWISHTKFRPAVMPKTLRRPPAALTANGKAPPNISKPHGGRSYNPSFDSWSSLLKNEGDKAVATEKKRLEQAAQEKVREERIAKSAEEADQSSTKENDGTGMASGVEEVIDSEWEGIESDMDEVERLRQKRPERKTPAERNKTKRRKEKETQEKHEKQMKERDAQAAQAKKVSKELSAKAKSRALIPHNHNQDLTTTNDHQEITTAEETNNENLPLRKTKYSKTPIPESALEIVLPDELRDSLRMLKPEGNLLNDRFRNFMVQGRTEPRPRPVGQVRKAKMKRVEKWSYKDWDMDRR